MIRMLAWVWAGIVIGVSFIAAPVKFTAESLTRPVALDVGRATFHALSYTEWVLLAVLIFLAWRERSSGGQPSRRAVQAAGVVLVVLVLQTAWLLPALDDRVASIINGVDPPSSPLHTIYGVLEVAKVGALLALGVFAVPQLQTASASSPDRVNVAA